MINNKNLDAGSSASIEWSNAENSGKISINAYQEQSGGFLANNWQDVAFMANDLAQAGVNNSSLNAALRMGRSTTMLNLPPGVALPVSTDAIAAIARIGRPIGKAAPWVAVGAIAYNIINNRKITAGDVYQGVVTGLSVIPDWGLVIGGASLLAEGISYYYTG